MPFSTAVRPPEYFPRPEYAALMLSVDRFVLADTFPFSRQGHHNRMRIRTPQGAGWQWLTVPREGASVGRPLHAVGIDAAQPWARMHRRAIHLNYGMAPFYDHYRHRLDALLDRPWGYLGDLAVATTRWVHEALGGTADLACASDLPGAPASLPAVWAALDAPGVLATLPESAERDAAHLAFAGGAVRVLCFDEPVRRQNFPGFVGGVSTLDLLFNYGPDAAALLREGVTAWRDVVC